jgi:hypothetical protein
MSKKLYLIGFFFVLAWIIGYTLFAAGGYIHILFGIAFILFVLSEVVKEKIA